MKTIGTIEAYGETLRLQLDKYCADNTTAIWLVDVDGEPFGSLTVGIPGTALAEDEILAKTWGENMEFRSPALASGLFTDTGRRVTTGYAIAEVWRLHA